MKRAIKFYETIGYDPNNYFGGVTKMLRQGSGALRAIKECNQQFPDRSGSGVSPGHLSPQQHTDSNKPMSVTEAAPPAMVGMSVPGAHPTDCRATRALSTSGWGSDFLPDTQQK